eukprot:scaffold45655_cov22-Tisochrysis_lutea.AAC.1
MHPCAQLVKHVKEVRRQAAAEKVHQHVSSNNSASILAILRACDHKHTHEYTTCAGSCPQSSSSAGAATCSSTGSPGSTASRGAAGGRCAEGTGRGRGAAHGGGKAEGGAADGRA